MPAARARADGGKDPAGGFALGEERRCYEARQTKANASWRIAGQAVPNASPTKARQVLTDADDARARPPAPALITE
ncbi:hypothetical protein HFO61_34140 [Rhizobium leguminosarum]|uniref:hypothetical protein n=1 Tax=Rhizobium leguminosarum TaxID=384 RepID=UPI001C98ABF1|nr:hypothetical protein [Rhizobium leguminosarum]MBY5551744.1 hypothetical protein [Rhizobium leguminosarum]